MSRRVLLPFFALLAIAVTVPCFVSSGTRSGNAALRAPRHATATSQTSQSVALVQVTKEKLGKNGGATSPTSGNLGLKFSNMTAQGFGSHLKAFPMALRNTIATAGVLGGVTGLLLGGFWIGAAGFVATSYLAKKEDDDVSTVLKGVSSASLEALNFVDYLNQKYEVSGKVGAALSDALDSSEGETSSSVKSALGTVNGAIDSFDKDIGIRETLGGLVLAGSDLANQLATKVVELNKEYKVTDQLKSKIDEAVASSKS
eukprot:s124_g1.t1